MDAQVLKDPPLLVTIPSKTQAPEHLRAVIPVWGFLEFLGVFQLSC